MQMLDLDPDLPANGGKVRKSWRTNGAPAWKIDEDIAFIRVGELDDAFGELRDRVYGELDADFARETTAYTRILDVHWIFYGPDSFDHAFRIRNRLYNEQYRQLLNDHQIFVIPRVPAPRRMPEMFAGQWWERTDLSAMFNELVKTDQKVAYLKSAQITVKGTKDTDASVDETTNPRVGNNR
jgi:hypothetical protein